MFYHIFIYIYNMITDMQAAVAIILISMSIYISFCCSLYFQIDLFYFFENMVLIPLRMLYDRHII